MKLAANNIGLTFGDAPILNQLSLSLDAHCLTMLIGPNGSGKTSLIRTLCGELKPATGGILLEGKKITSWQPIERAKKMAVLFQNTPVNFDISVEQIIRLGRRPHGTSEAVNRAIIADVMSAMDLSAMATRSFVSLSGGEQQRVQIARVLSQVWQLESSINAVLILDEPLAALDIVYQYQLLQLLHKLRSRGLTILVSIHDLNLASLFADQMVLLNKGSVVAAGTPNSVFTQEHLQQVFEQPCDIIEHPGTGRPQMMFSAEFSS
ncbi:MAG: heme ABC transporter ATP-binding protein [Pseudomonadales bacterium]|nr:heme ABC transporter ATP-binding protein [Pseudomonadales bacterium]